MSENADKPIYVPKEKKKASVPRFTPGRNWDSTNTLSTPGQPYRLESGISRISGLMTYEDVDSDAGHLTTINSPAVFNVRSKPIKV